MSLFVKSLFVDVDPEHDWVEPLLSSGGKRDEEPEVAQVEGVNAIQATEAAVKPTQPLGP
jgi:hypothetical protein